NVTADSGALCSAATGTVQLGVHGRSGLHGLTQVEHDGLPHHRIEQLLRGAGDPRTLHEVPDQELVVRLRQRVVVDLVANRATAPSVRGVKRMGEYDAGDRQARGAQLVVQILGRVDTTEAARVGVVVVRQLTAQLLGPFPGHRHRGDATRLE